MPAATHRDNGTEADLADEVDEPGHATVTDHLDRALAAAQEEEMSASELMGLFFYYAHSIAESYRQDALGQDALGQGGLGQDTDGPEAGRH